MLKVLNPATGQLIKEVKEDTAQSVREKFLAARDAQPGWAELPLSYRIQALRKFRTLLEERREPLAALLTSEVGKPITQSHNEIKGTLTRLDFFVENVADCLAEETVFIDRAEKMEERIEHEPLGVVGNISAWNYPYFVGSNVFIPALLTGNAILYKPSEFATLTGLAIAELLHEAGVPRDIFIPIVGGGEIGVELLKHRLNGIFFTGSYKTGVAVAEAAAKHLMKVQLELGGKDPVYVCEDGETAPVAASIADGAFYNNGQSCCSVERIYVNQSIYKEFTEAFVKEVAKFKVGDPMSEETYLGPLTRAPHVQYLEAQVADAVAKGATILCGGKRVSGKGNYFQPTVLINVTPEMAVMREETFGPVIGIQSVATDEEAVNAMNDTEYGLTASVFSRDAARAKKILARVNSGSAYWNCTDRVSPRLPWSGRGNSGTGCTLSIYGIQAFLVPKAWHLKGK